MCFQYKLYFDATFTVFCVNTDKIPFAILTNHNYEMQKNVFMK